MLYFNFTRIFKARGIDKPFTFLVNAGYSANYATRVVNNRFEKINLKDLERLCELLNCTPHDLLYWTPSSNTQNIDTHPLKPLHHTDTHSLNQILYNIPLNKLGEVEAIVKQTLEK